MDEKIAKLQELIDKHDFLEEQVYRRRVGSRIFVPRTDCIIRNMIFHRRRS